MIKLGQTTTATDRGNVKYMWLVKDMNIREKYSKTKCYVVMGFIPGSGWWTLYNGTLKDCRKYIGNETPIKI